MAELIRDTVFGHFVRLITNNRYLQYAEEKDPSLWKRYIDREQTFNMARHGNVTGPEELKEKESEPQSLSESGGERNSPGDSDQGLTSAVTQQTTHEHQIHSALTNQRVDTEKGRDATIVSWWGDNDQEVRWYHPSSPAGPSRTFQSLRWKSLTRI